MHSSLIKLILLSMFIALFSLTSFATPFFKITPLENDVSVYPGDTVYIDYQVQNISGKTVHSLMYIQPHFTNFARSNCPASLPNFGSCLLTVGFETAPTDQPGTFNLSPLVVCAFDGELCSATSDRDRVSITILPIP